MSELKKINDFFPSNRVCAAKRRQTIFRQNDVFCDDRRIFNYSQKLREINFGVLTKYLSKRKYFHTLHTFCDGNFVFSCHKIFRETSCDAISQFLDFSILREIKF